jgi:hypothetical protein
MRTITIDECTKMIRAALKQGFPLTKFSVRKTRSTYSHNIDVSWTDGPTQKQVKPILDRFKSTGFDGMTDCSYSCGKRMLGDVEVEVTGNYVTGNRTISNGLRSRITEKLATECGLGKIELNEWGQMKAGESSMVPFAFHSHYMDSEYISLEQLQAKRYILAHDSHSTTWFSTLLHRVESVVSLEEQKPIDAALLPEYIDVNATVSTGRAEEFEPRQPMFEGHAAYEAEQETAEQPEQAPVPVTASNVIEFHCKVGRSYPRRVQPSAMTVQ